MTPTENSLAVTDPFAGLSVSIPSLVLYGYNRAFITQQEADYLVPSSKEEEPESPAPLSLRTNTRLLPPVMIRAENLGHLLPDFIRRYRDHRNDRSKPLTVRSIKDTVLQLEKEYGVDDIYTKKEQAMLDLYVASFLLLDTTLSVEEAQNKLHHIKELSVTASILLARVFPLLQRHSFPVGYTESVKETDRHNYKGNTKYQSMTIREFQAYIPTIRKHMSALTESGLDSGEELPRLLARVEAYLACYEDDAWLSRRHISFITCDMVGKDEGRTADVAGLIEDLDILVALASAAGCSI